MVLHPYEKLYLEDVADNVGGMLKYAVDCRFNATIVWQMFVCSKVAMEIEKGNPKYLASYSGRDYLSIIINAQPVNEIAKNERLLCSDTAENYDRYYWAGYIIAKYQFESQLSFFDINKYLPIEVVLGLFDALHQANEKKFYEIANERIAKVRVDTNLKMIRKASGLTQQQLAQRANVEVRSIQMYEQKRNDINKAQVDTLYKLSRVLGCGIEELMERQNVVSV